MILAGPVQNTDQLDQGNEDSVPVQELKSVLPEQSLVLSVLPLKRFLAVHDSLFTDEEDHSQILPAISFCFIRPERSQDCSTNCWLHQAGEKSRMLYKLVSSSTSESQKTHARFVMKETALLTLTLKRCWENVILCVVELPNHQLCAAGEVAKRLKALPTHAEDLSSFPRTHQSAYNYLGLQFQGTQGPVLASTVTNTPVYTFPYNRGT